MCITRSSWFNHNMMTSSNGNIFRVTGPLCGEFTGPANSPHKGQWRGALMFSLICVWINRWVNNREAGDLRRYRAHYDVIVMTKSTQIQPCAHFMEYIVQSGPLNVRCRFITSSLPNDKSSLEKNWNDIQRKICQHINFHQNDIFSSENALYFVIYFTANNQPQIK